jgi:two-component system LytT family sensor kinase
MNQINDRWVRIGGVVFLFLPLLINEMTSSGLRRAFWDEVIYIGIYIVSVILILESGRLIILALHKKYSEPGTSKKRFVKACAFVLLSDFALILLTFYGSHFVRGMHATHSPALFFLMFVVSSVLALAQVGIYEGFYYFARLRKVEQEKEELLRVNLQSQFDSLKQQVNPHFLFNSINTVSSLIDKDADRAKKYLAEMSKVYRYLLRTNEEELTTLKIELQFIDSYFHLLKTRFGDGLRLNIAVEETFKNYYLPALTLQLLIENAVKHNSIDKAKPLIIDIATKENGWLSVKNNLQKRINVIPSTKIGLSNIMAKYKLLNQPEVMIHETLKEFAVFLPLIKNNQS